MVDSILPMRLENVSFQIGDKRLLKDLDAEFTAGTRTIVVGPNGAGKSLLLRVCHGLLKPSAGTVLWQGPNPGRRQAMVFQRPVMLRRSVAANIDYALSVAKVPRDERAGRVAEALGRVGMARFSDSPARVLSFGEQQKLALARAWALRPEVLFLDEPTASLDPAATHQVEEIIEGIHAEGTKLVMVTHDLEQARRLADEVVFMHRGRMLEKSPAGKFFDEPENDLARAYLRGELLWWRKRELTPPNIE